MARKKKTSSRRKKVVSSPGKVGLILIFVSLLYFFVNFYVPSSPLTYIHLLTDFFFGKTGTHFFFGILLALGIMFILYPANWKERAFLYSFITFLFLLAILSFPLLEENNSDIIFSNGGYIGYGIIKLISILMGNSLTGIKVFTIILFTISFIFTSWRLNLFLLIPKIEFEIPEDKIKKERKIIKVNLSKSKSKTEKDNVITKTTSSSETKHDNSLLKNIFKDKIKKEIEKKEEVKKQISYPKDKPTFKVENLEHGTENYTLDDETLIKQAYDIKAKLDEFNIPVEIAGYEVGPSVIQFKIKPAKGIKVASIEKLKKDLALSLKSSIRILAPIPGTEYVGIEMPNPKSSIVYLSDVLGSNKFSSAMNKALTNLSVGKTITGDLFLEPLENMPHLLVAGQTGSGKSVAINDYIISLLYQNTPAELKFIMVDPKQVELGLYDGLPHLLAPIINDPEKALRALKWSVDIMNRRYAKLKELKVRNIYEYNEKVEDKDKMNRIVIIIDELADLMMSGNKKEVEHNIARIAQMARAVGMHLILATQRPSVNVITGLIKSNIPTRIAFGVVSNIDSRTILDRGGAEDLLGKGDLLFVSPKHKHPIRIQAPYISTEDTETIIDELKNKYIASLDSEDDIYDKELLDALEGNKPESSYEGGNAGDDEELIQQAIEIIQQTRKASITLLQRRLKVGFARAARLMDQLEERGIVGPQEGSKSRDILI